MFNGVPLLGWFLGTLAAIAGGAIWFGPKTFYPMWWKAMGRSLDSEPGSAPGGEAAAKGSMGQIFGLTFLGAGIQVAVLGFALVQMGVSGPAAGAQAALILGIGLAAFTSLSHRLFGGHGLKVWIIEVASDVLNLTIAGAILGAFLA